MEHDTFEQGPIRPPSEAASLLLRFTRNCPWNRCTFCPVYKGTRFTRRSLEEIKRDIDAVARIREELLALPENEGREGGITKRALGAAFSGPRSQESRRRIALWLYAGQGSVFIQDANSLVLPGTVLVEALRYLREKVPGIRRITSYARSSTLARKTVAELRAIREAGLDRIHIGMESGSDRVLKMVQKGVSAREQVEAGRKVIEAGMELSEYVMPGLGGKDLSEEHARESARVLNAIDPHFIRLRSLRVPARAPLYRDKSSGRFVSLSDDETVREIRLFIASLEGIRSRVASDHIMNLLEEVAGKLPEDKEAMLAVIDRYLALPPDERLLFRIGRRGGTLRSVDELSDPALRARLEAARHELASLGPGDIGEILDELADRYI